MKMDTKETGIVPTMINAASKANIEVHALCRNVSILEGSVHVELCGATAAVHDWGNEDLLPNIPVNTNAMARITQLVQDGFVQITEWD